jgi:hypothetical protein
MMRYLALLVLPLLLLACARDTDTGSTDDVTPVSDNTAPTYDDGMRTADDTASSTDTNDATTTDSGTSATDSGVAPSDSTTATGAAAADEPTARAYASESPLYVNQQGSNLRLVSTDEGSCSGCYVYNYQFDTAKGGYQIGIEVRDGTAYMTDDVRMIR